MKKIPYRIFKDSDNINLFAVYDNNSENALYVGHYKNCLAYIGGLTIGLTHREILIILSR